MVCVFLILQVTCISTGLQLARSAVDLSLFPALRMLETSLIVAVWDSFWSVCSNLATLTNSPMTLDMLTIPIHLDGEEELVDGG